MRTVHAHHLWRWWNFLLVSQVGPYICGPNIPAQCEPTPSSACAGLQPKLVKGSDQTWALRSNCPKSGKWMKDVWLPRKIPHPLLFYLDLFVWTLSCGWSLEIIAFTLTFSVFPGKDSWKFLWRPAGTLHTVFIAVPLSPLFKSFSPFHNCRLSPSKPSPLMVMHLSNGQNESSGLAP